MAVADDAVPPEGAGLGLVFSLSNFIPEQPDWVCPVRAGEASALAVDYGHVIQAICTAAAPPVPLTCAYRLA
jgi:hypothetical protein